MRLLSRSGGLLALRYDLRYPFAAWLAQQAQAAPALAAAGGLDYMRRWGGGRQLDCHICADGGLDSVKCLSVPLSEAGSIFL